MSLTLADGLIEDQSGGRDKGISRGRRGCKYHAPRSHSGNMLSCRLLLYYQETAPALKYSIILEGAEMESLDTCVNL